MPLYQFGARRPHSSGGTRFDRLFRDLNVSVGTPGLIWAGEAGLGICFLYNGISTAMASRDILYNFVLLEWHHQEIEHHKHKGIKGGEKKWATSKSRKRPFM